MRSLPASPLLWTLLVVTPVTMAVQVNVIATLLECLSGLHKNYEICITDLGEVAVSTVGVYLPGGQTDDEPMFDCIATVDKIADVFYTSNVTDFNCQDLLYSRDGHHECAALDRFELRSSSMVDSLPNLAGRYTYNYDGSSTPKHRF